MEAVDISGKALVDHWKWAAEKGLMNVNTANALRAACAQVLGVLDRWETVDVQTLVVDDVCRRFRNKRSKDFKPESLEAYERRFGQAVRMFLDFAKDPSAWKPVSQERAGRREKKQSANSTADSEVSTFERPISTSSLLAGLVEYPFPLREGRLAYLRLPADLKLAEVKRLTAYLTTLAVDTELA